MTEIKKLTIKKVLHILKMITPFFDLVRLVDALETTVISLDSNNKIVKHSERCYEVWNRTTRCENCTSMCATFEECKKMKYETRDNEVYHVISHPIQAVDESGVEHNVVIEIVNRVSNQSVFEQMGIHEVEGRSIIDFLEEMHKKIYEDALTCAYNRRYLDEYIFLHANNNQVAKKVTFIMVDLNKFKQINDTMGHDEGDRILIEVASVFKKNIRKQDSLIRMGGDEFIIVLVDLEKEQIASKVQVLREEVQKICINEEQQIYVDADFGAAFTDHYLPTKEFTKAMIKEADQSMYEKKRKRDL